MVRTNSRQASAAPTAAAPAAAPGLGPPLQFPTGPILETDYANVAGPARTGNWTKRAVPGGRVFYDPRGPKYGYMNVHDPDNQYDEPLTGLSGTIVDDPETSSSDLPFVHPFRNDFEFLVAPDPPYEDLVGPTMQDSYATATTTAQQEFGLSVDGVIGMEFDAGMVPGAYKPVKGDRVCLWGRWIIDAGHNDFHTEIHPPLLMVTGHPASSQFQSARASAKDATTCRFLARPFLVSQDFNGHGLPGHLLDEIFKVVTFRSLRVEAHPQLLPSFVGQNFMMFKIRPPTPRKDPRDQLLVTYELTRRSRSVAIQLLRGTDGDSVRVLVVLNDASYDPPPEPKHHNVSLTLAELAGLDPGVGGAIVNAIGVAFPALPGHAVIILDRGIHTHRYAALTAPPLTSPITKEVGDLRAVDVPVDTSHPFPVAGAITVEWKRFALAAPPGQVSRSRRAGTGG